MAPKLLGPQWKEELETKFDLPAQVVIGKDLIRAEQAKRLSAQKAAARAKHAKRAKVAHLMLELVKAGRSIAAAGRLLGLTQGKTQHISQKMRLGTITQHGPWRAGDR